MQEFIDAGADLSFAKPFQHATLEAILEFIREFGTQSLANEINLHKAGHATPRLEAASKLMPVPPNYC